MTNRFLPVVHAALAAALPFLLVLLFGCELVPRLGAEDPKTDFGPEVSDEALELALSRAIDGATLQGIDVGQYLEYVTSRRLEAEDGVTTIAGVHVEVAGKEQVAETADTYTIRFQLVISDSQRQADGGFETKVTEEPLEIDFPKEAPAALAVSGASLRAYTDRAVRGAPHAFMALTEPQATATRQTIHNLKTSSETTAAPGAVAGKPGCGGLASCALHKRWVSFDVVQWFDKGAPVKVHLDYGFSLDTPILPYGQYVDEKWAGLLVSYCVSGYVPITGRTVFVRDCKNIEDFQK